MLMIGGLGWRLDPVLGSDGFGLWKVIGLDYVKRVGPHIQVMKL